MFPRKFRLPRRRPIAISRRLGFRKRRGFKTPRMARAITVRTPIRVKLATRSPPGQAGAASCQFLQREKKDAQQRQAITNMAAAKESDCRLRTCVTAVAAVASATSHPSYRRKIGQTTGLSDEQTDDLTI